jgi:exodeoxyribonuclease VII large subunit
MRIRLANSGDRVEALGQRLRHPRDVIEAAGDRLKQSGERLDVAWGAYEKHVTGRFERLDAGPRLRASIERMIRTARDRTAAAGQLLESYSYRNVLERGFALVRDADGQPVMRAAQAVSGAAVEIEFFDGKRGAVIDGEDAPPAAKSGQKPARRKPSDGGDDGQGSLL